MIEPKKVKPPKLTIEDLLKSNQLVKGQVIIDRKRVMDEAIEFERRNRKRRLGNES